MIRFCAATEGAQGAQRSSACEKPPEHAEHPGNPEHPYRIPYFARISRTRSNGIAWTVLSLAVTVVAAKSELWMDSSVASIAAWNSADACSFASSVVVSRVAFQGRRTDE